MKSILVKPDSAIVERLFKKKLLLESNDPAHKEIRPALIILGGGMRGVSGGGAVTALNRLGLNGVFDVVIGASAGAPIGAYFLAGYEQTRLGTSLFYDELRGRSFIDPFNLGEIAHVDILGRSFRSSSKKLDTKAVVEHRSDLYMALTDYIDGSSQLVLAKEHPDELIRFAEISSAIPFLYRRPLYMHKRRYVDGSVAFSVRRTLESDTYKRYDPTDILLISNFEEQEVKNHNYNLLETAASFFNHHFERLLLRRIQLFDDIEFLSSLPSTNVGILATPPGGVMVNNLETNPKKLWRLGDAMLQSTLSAFGKPDLYEPLPKPMSQKILDKELAMMAATPPV